MLGSLRMGLLGPLVRHFIRIGNKCLLPPKEIAMISRSFFCNEQMERLIF